MQGSIPVARKRLFQLFGRDGSAIRYIENMQVYRRFAVLKSIGRWVSHRRKGRVWLWADTAWWRVWTKRLVGWDEPIPRARLPCASKHRRGGGRGLVPETASRASILFTNYSVSLTGTLPSLILPLIIAIAPALDVRLLRLCTFLTRSSWLPHHPRRFDR